MAKLTKADVRWAFESGFKSGFGMSGIYVNAHSSDEEFCTAIDAAWTHFNWDEPQKKMKRTHLGGQTLAAQARMIDPEIEHALFMQPRLSKKRKSAAAGGK